MFLNAVKVFASPSPPSQTQYNGEHFAAEFRRVRRKEGGGGRERGVGVPDSFQEWSFNQYFRHFATDFKPLSGSTIVTYV